MVPESTTPTVQPTWEPAVCVLTGAHTSVPALPLHSPLVPAACGHEGVNLAAALVGEKLGFMTAFGCAGFCGQRQETQENPPWNSDGVP